MFGIAVIILIVSVGMKFQRSSTIGIIGGADGPTSVFVSEVQENDEKAGLLKNFVSSL